MHAHLPQPDPNEGIGDSLPALELAAPAMCFPLGPPSAADERLADAILESRPGALIVYGRR
jgi:hypothetical protein